MRAPLICLWVSFATACTCASEPTPTTDAPPSAASGEKPPVLRQVEFRIPLTAMDDADLEALRQVVLEAAVAADPGAAPAQDDALTPWKCRQATIWRTDGGDTPTIARWERFAETTCAGTIERWWAEQERVTTDRPTGRIEGGSFAFETLFRQQLATADGWTTGYVTRHTLDEGKETGPYSHAPDWLGTQLPDGMTLGASGSIRSERWALTRLSVADERITVEADRWTCTAPDGTTKLAGSALALVTNRRAPGHAPNRPKDAMVLPRLQAFADALRTRLADRIGGPGTTPDAALACVE